MLGPRTEAVTALVVEDDPQISRLVRELLTRQGHEVTEVADGALAVSAVHALRPDVVLLDVGLPNVHGFEILEELKRDPDTCEIPVIMVTAWWTDELDARARALGAAFAMAKPFDIGALCSAVASAAAGTPAAPQMA